ncbi:MAG: serine/threonine-protein kinase [Pseudomonadota bacterium]|nr:serine/threonine-protein kinase [Pseudomonadota bacterium]
MAQIAIGEVLGGRLRVLGALGRGGMATVHLVEEVATGERLALKVLHPHLSADPAARRRLEREVAAGRRLDHPGLLTARELFEADGVVGLLLPLHPGRTLAERVAMEGPLPPDQVVRLGLRLAEALGAAHRAGVLHRDVTARNVMVDDRGTPMLTDLGLARIGEGGTARSTALVGTAGFLAPEVLAGVRSDPRSDLYGLGAVLYLAATGAEPFAAAHPQAAFHKQLTGDVAPIAAAGFPPWLATLIQGLLDPDPARRPQGATAVVTLLEEGRAPEPAEPRPARAAPNAPADAHLVHARLPTGTYTVVVKEASDHRDARKAKRALRKGAERARVAAERHGGLVADVSRLVGQAAAAIEGVAGAPGPTTEARLAAAVGAAAGLPEGAVREATALGAEKFRLVAHVDRPTAERLANEARALDLMATVYPEREPTDLSGWLLSRWWALIPLMWIAFPPIAALTESPLIVFLFAGLTVALATIVGPWVGRHMLPGSARDLPVAYTNELGAHLAAGLRAAVASDAAVGPSNESVAPARGDGSRVATISAQALAALDGLDGVVAAGKDLPALVKTELRASVSDLRREVHGIAADAAEMEAELVLAVREAQADTGGAWASERLARLDTLARGGTSVDSAERARLLAAMAAHEAAAMAESALDARLTADLARLLEIDATARRLRRELALERGAARAPEQALADLQERASAAARARRELMGR